MRPLNRTYRNILFESGAFDTPATLNLNKADSCVSCAETQGPERIAVSLCMILSVMDAFEVLYTLVFCVITAAYYTRRDAGSAECDKTPDHQ